MTPESAKTYLRKVVFRWYCWRKHHKKLIEAIEVLLAENERLKNQQILGIYQVKEIDS